jgi:hypothetical protein
VIEAGVEMLARARLFHGLGFAVLLFDFQAGEDFFKARLRQ